MNSIRLSDFRKDISATLCVAKSLPVNLLVHGESQVTLVSPDWGAFVNLVTELSQGTNLPNAELALILEYQVQQPRANTNPITLTIVLRDIVEKDKIVGDFHRISHP